MISTHSWSLGIAGAGLRVLRFMLVFISNAFRISKFASVVAIRSAALLGVPFSERTAARLGLKYDFALAAVVLALSGLARERVWGEDWLMALIITTFTWLEDLIRDLVTKVWLLIVALSFTCWLLTGVCIWALAGLIVHHPNYVPITHRDALDKRMGGRSHTPARQRAVAVAIAMTLAVALPGFWSLLPYSWFLLGLYWLRTSHLGKPIDVVDTATSG